jgi:hypothetical protein
LGDDVIVQHLRNHGVASPPAAHDLIVLKQQGVSDAVLRALQDAGQPEILPPTPVPAPAPLVVEEYYLPRPYPVVVYPRPVPPWHGPHRLVRHPSPRLRWGISVSN